MTARDYLLERAREVAHDCQERVLALKHEPQSLGACSQKRDQQVRELELLYQRASTFRPVTDQCLDCWLSSETYALLIPSSHLDDESGDIYLCRTCGFRGPIPYLPDQ